MYDGIVPIDATVWKTVLGSVRLASEMKPRLLYVI